MHELLVILCCPLHPLLWWGIRMRSSSPHQVEHLCICCKDIHGSGCMFLLFMLHLFIGSTRPCISFSLLFTKASKYAKRRRTLIPFFCFPSAAAAAAATVVLFWVVAIGNVRLSLWSQCVQQTAGNRPLEGMWKTISATLSHVYRILSDAAPVKSETDLCH